MTSRGVREPATASLWPDDVSLVAGRLLDAAVAAFAERGYHGTTTRDIAGRAGLSPAGLYVHYPSKAAVLGHLSRIGHERALALVLDSLAAPGSSRDRLHHLVRTFVAWHAEHRTMARVVQHELAALTPPDRAEVTRLRRALERAVAAEVRRGVTTGELVVPAVRQATRAMLSLAVDVARWYDPAGRESPQRLGRVYADLALRMLGAETKEAP